MKSLRQAGLLFALTAPLLVTHASLLQTQQTPEGTPPSPAQPAPKPLKLPLPPPKPQTAKPDIPSAAGEGNSLPRRTSDPEHTGEPTPEKEHVRSAVSPSFAAVPMNRTVVVLDPAHGGVDGGSRIGDSIQEKDVTLALAFKLRSLLTARGFTVVMTRDSDEANEPTPAGSPLTLDDRAGIANHARAVACLLLHATGSGTGAHLYSSELPPAAGEGALPAWLTAQAPWVMQSRALESSLGAALSRARLPLVSSQASVRPVDSLGCPALVIELAPRTDDAASINDDSYQQHAAEAIAGALVFWRNQAVAPTRLPASTAITEPRRTAAEGAVQP